MIRFETLRAALGAIAALALAAALTGCDKKPTAFAGGVPEGVRDPNAMLVTFRNDPLPISVFDYDTQGSAVGVVTPLPLPETTPILELFDGTNANSFEVYRQGSDGAFRRLEDFALQSELKFIGANFELYFDFDATASGSPTYIMRGLIDGVATRQSPLSNNGVYVNPTLGNVVYIATRTPSDSAFTMQWNPVPEAVGYWVHVYEKPISSGAHLASALPAPLSFAPAKTVFYGYVAGASSYKLGSPTGATVLHYTPPLNQHDYQVRISAVNAQGEMIATTSGDADSVAASADVAYLVPPEFTLEKSKIYFNNGAVTVTPHRGPAPAFTLEPTSAATAGPSWSEIQRRARGARMLLPAALLDSRHPYSRWN